MANLAGRGLALAAAAVVGSSAGSSAGCAGCAEVGDELPIAAEHSALIGGTPALPGEDEAVVALTTNGFPFCTGTLISPRVVLTAAHCVDMGGDNTMYFGHDVQEGTGRRIEVLRTQTHPKWSGNVGVNDVGVALLKFPQDPELPVPMNRSAASDHIDEPYRIVGFGTFAVEPNMADGKKRIGTSTIRGVQSDVLLTGDDLVRVCFGDSGGPGFVTVDDVEYVAGIHSYTLGQQCLPPMGDTRVDLHVDSFIQPFIDANDTTCRADGICARIGCVDDPDCLPCGPNGECVTDCPLPDWDCPTQSLGDVCQANTQCDTGICVFWQQQPETKFCTIACTPGGSECPSGMTCQNRPDAGSDGAAVCYFAGGDEPPGLVGDDCAGPADCGSQRCEEGHCTTECDGINDTLLCPLGAVCENRTGEFLCFPEQTDDGGGCRVSRRGDNRLAWLLALVGLVLLRRRRRSRSGPG